MTFMVSNTLNSLVMNANQTATTYGTWTGPAFTATSDSFFKDNQQLVNIDDCLQVFNNVFTKTYVRNDMPKNLENNITHVGFVAQDLKKHYQTNLTT